MESVFVAYSVNGLQKQTGALCKECGGVEDEFREFVLQHNDDKWQLYIRSKCSIAEIKGLYIFYLQPQLPLIELNIEWS